MTLACHYHGPDYAISNNPEWPSAVRYRATYDFATLVRRDTYSLTISGAQGTDGIPIAPNRSYTFTVDYAGYMADTTPPDAPSVIAWGDDTATTLSARWSASDPESAITLYQHAIGTTPGWTEVVNWPRTGALGTRTEAISTCRPPPPGSDALAPDSRPRQP